MTSGIGQNVVDSLGKKDLNKDGNIINLAIVGSSRFYDFEIFEDFGDCKVFGQQQGEPRVRISLCGRRRRRRQDGGAAECQQHGATSDMRMYCIHAHY